MDEENKTVVGTENGGANNDATVQAAAGEEKKFTQKDIDDAVSKRLERERRRTDKMYAGYDGFKKIYQTLKENGVVKSENPEEAVNDISQFYARADGDSVGEPSATEPRKSAEVALPKDDKIALAKWKASDFASSAPADVIEDEFQTLKEKGKKRTDEDDVRFSIIGQKLAEINAKKGIQKQIDDFKAKFPKTNLDELKSDADFAQFSKLSKAPLADTYDFYLKMKNVKPAEKKDLGSVSSQGGVPETNLYTAEEIRKMTPDERSKNDGLIRQSILANMKKSMKT